MWRVWVFVAGLPGGVLSAWAAYGTPLSTTALAIAALDVGALAASGEPTGLALSPDGSMLVLGQRRAIDGRVEERLVVITLDCGTGSWQGGDRDPGGSLREWLGRQG